MNYANLVKFLEQASVAYYTGNPIIPDSVFDRIADIIQFKDVGYKSTENDSKHAYAMYSLNKHYGSLETLPEFFKKERVYTPKLDGSAISILYTNNKLIQVLTRGDGVTGQDITDKAEFIAGIIQKPQFSQRCVQITGEVVAPLSVANARNYVAGALNLKDITDFRKQSDNLQFIAYAIQPYDTHTYLDDMKKLSEMGFLTVADTTADFSKYPTDGTVVRLNNNKVYENLGYTAHHPRGAIAVKKNKPGVETTLLDVIWKTGRSGKVTPIAILEPVMIGDALVSRATLHNPKFIQDMELHIGDTVEVIRSGDIIPCIVARKFSD